MISIVRPRVWEIIGEVPVNTADRGDSPTVGAELGIIAYKR